MLKRDLKIRPNIGKKRGSDFELGPMNVELSFGSFFAIIGPNGSGKSTLLEAILETLLPKSGAEFGLSFLTQSEKPWVPMTVSDYVSLGTPLKSVFGETNKKCEEALDWMNVGHLTQRSIQALSEGEWRRVVLARGLLQLGLPHQPEAQNLMLLMDEPSAHLDPFQEKAFFEGLKGLQQEMKNRSGLLTVIAVLHDLSLVRQYSDEFLGLNGGRCVELGGKEKMTDSTFQRIFSGGG